MDISCTEGNKRVLQFCSFVALNLRWFLFNFCNSMGKINMKICFFKETAKGELVCNI